jgi:hypothetical protein
MEPSGSERALEASESGRSRRKGCWVAPGRHASVRQSPTGRCRRTCRHRSGQVETRDRSANAPRLGRERGPADRAMFEPPHEMGQRRCNALAPAPERSSDARKAYARRVGEARRDRRAPRSGRATAHEGDHERVIESGRSAGLKGKTPEATVAALSRRSARRILAPRERRPNQSCRMSNTRRRFGAGLPVGLTGRRGP